MIGVMLRQPNPDAVEAVGRAGWRIVSEPFECEHTLLWLPSAALDLEMFPPLVAWLSRWEVAVPLRTYTVLAENLGSEEERQASLPVLGGDLRQPVYDSRVLMIRRCARTRRLIKVWTQQETVEGENRDLAFLRAVWRVKPLLLALPRGWVKP